MVPRFFMNLRFRDRMFNDEEGDELPDAAAARSHALQAARDLIAHGRMDTIRDWFDCTFEITDERGSPVATVPFADTMAENGV